MAARDERLFCPTHRHVARSSHAAVGRSLSSVEFGLKESMNPALGVFFHWIGGLASASFYIPFRGVKHWAWETYWLVGGFFSWIIAPGAAAFLLVPHSFA